MIEGPVDGHRAGGIMGHQHDLLYLQGIKYCLQISLLLSGGVGIVRRFVRSSPAQKVEGDDLAIAQIGSQAVVDVQVIGKTVHEDQGETSSCIMARIDRRGSTPDSMFGVRTLLDRTG